MPLLQPILRVLLLDVRPHIALVVTLVRTELARVQVPAQVDLHVLLEPDLAAEPFGAHGTLVLIAALAMRNLDVVPQRLLVEEVPAALVAHETRRRVVTVVHVLLQVLDVATARDAFLLRLLLVHVEDVLAQRVLGLELHAADVADVVPRVEMNVEDVEFQVGEDDKCLLADVARVVFRADAGEVLHTFAGVFVSVLVPPEGL